jgi:hypothetical protein
VPVVWFNKQNQPLLETVGKLGSVLASLFTVYYSFVTMNKKITLSTTKRACSTHTGFLIMVIVKLKNKQQNSPGTGGTQ